MSSCLGSRWIPFAIALAALAPPAHAAPTLIGVSFADGLVYDVDAQTGAATNPRAVASPDIPCTPEVCPSNELRMFAGVEVEADGSLLLATVESFPYLPSTLFRWTGGTSLAQTLGPAGAQLGEGDLALDPVSGDLFAVGLTNMIAPFTLLRIDLANVAAGATVVGEIGASDISALAFDAAGTLYAIDTDADRLLVLDPTDAHTVSSVDLSQPLGALAGMDFDPATGTLYVADGGTGGQNALFTLDTATGALAEIGPLGIANGLSGLAVPEPAATELALAAFGALAAIARRLR